MALGIEFLPFEVLSRLCEFLDIQNTISLRHTTRRLRFLVQESSLGHVVLVPRMARVKFFPIFALNFLQLRELLINASAACHLSYALYENLPQTLRRLEIVSTDCFAALFRHHTPTSLFDGRRFQLPENPYDLQRVVDVTTVFRGLHTLKMIGHLFRLFQPLANLLPSSIQHLHIASSSNEQTKWDSILPASLETLTIENSALFCCIDKFPSSLTKIALKNCQTILPAHFPQHLTDLTLEYKEDLDFSFLVQLPHLTSFNLENRYSYRQDLSRMEVFPLLKPPLKKLKLLQIPMEHSDFSKLPSGLTHLECALGVTTDSSIYALLPRSLVYVTLWRSYHRGDHRSDAFGPLDENLRLLPPSLTYFYNSLIKGWKSESASLLPRKLQHSANSCHFRPEHYSVLPETLKTLEDRSSEVISDSDVMRMPFRLVTLICLGKEFTNQTLGLLPRTLERLDLLSNETIDGDGFAHLPRGLTSLSCPQVGLISDGAISNLPPYLTHLQLLGSSDMTDASASMLPRSLQSLALKKTLNWGDEAMKNLPRCLIILYLPRAALITIDGFRHLPRTLENVNFQFNKNLTPELFNCLPPHLTILDLKRNFQFHSMSKKDIPEGLTFHCRSLRRSHRRRRYYY